MFIRRLNLSQANNAKGCFKRVVLVKNILEKVLLAVSLKNLVCFIFEIRVFIRRLNLSKGNNAESRNVIKAPNNLPVD